MRVVALEEHFTVPALASKYVKPEAIAKRGHYKGRKVAPGLYWVRLAQGANRRGTRPAARFASFQLPKCSITVCG